MTNIIIVLFELFLLLLFQKVSNYSPVLEVSYTAVESSVTCWLFNQIIWVTDVSIGHDHVGALRAAKMRRRVKIPRSSSALGVDVDVTDNIIRRS